MTHARIRQVTALAGLARSATLAKVGMKSPATRGLYFSDYVFPPPLGGSWNLDNEFAIKANIEKIYENIALLRNQIATRRGKDNKKKYLACQEIILS